MIPPELETEEDLTGEGAAALLAGADCSEDDRQAIVNWFQDAIHLLIAYQQNQTGEAALRMSLRAWTLALGFHLAAGADNAADLARSLGMSKQCVNKAMLHFIAQLRLEPLPWQRDEEGRKRMAEARRAQVSKTPQDAPGASPL